MVLAALKADTHLPRIFLSYKSNPFSLNILVGMDDDMMNIKNTNNKRNFIQMEHITDKFFKQ